MTTMQIDRATVEQALKALEFLSLDFFMLDPISPGREASNKAITALRAALAQQAEPVQPVWIQSDHLQKARVAPHLCRVEPTKRFPDFVALYTAPPQQAEPVTIERLRDALVASRIIPPAAVEDPEGYDDGVTLYRIEALHRRIT